VLWFLVRTAAVLTQTVAGGDTTSVDGANSGSPHRL